MNPFSSQPSAIAAAASSPLSAPPTLAHWERVTRHALVAARLGQVVLALANSWEALAIAQQLVEQPSPTRADDCVAALVVSHHNLADLHLQEGALDAAAGQLCRAHEALMALLQDSDRPTAIQQAAWRHSRETHAGLLGFLTEHGPHPAISRGLHAGCLAFAAGDSLPH